MFGFAKKQNTLEEVEKNTYENLETLRVIYGIIRKEEMTHEKTLRILLRRNAKKEEGNKAKNEGKDK
jgi:hypothetical protein